MPDVKGSKNILLEPADKKIGVTIRATVCSTYFSNDGFLPFSTTVSGVSVKVYNDNNADVTSDLVYAYPTISGAGDIKIELKYPGIEGRYKLEYILSLSDGSQKELTFHRIYAKDL